MTATGSAARTPAPPGESPGPHPQEPWCRCWPTSGDPWGSRGNGLLAFLPSAEAPALGCPLPHSLGCHQSLAFGSLCGPGMKVVGAKGSGDRLGFGALETYPLGLDLGRVPGNPASPTLMPSVPRRWWAGEWQLCSSSCGPGGLSRRAVLCIRSVGLDEQRALEPPACEHLPRPSAETPCNRDVACPATWVTGNWSQVSIRVGEARPQLHHWSRVAGGRGRLQGALTARHHGGKEAWAFRVQPLSANLGE